MSRGHYYNLEYSRELGVGTRLGGRFEGGATGLNQTCALWKGRPPTQTRSNLTGDVEPAAFVIGTSGGAFGQTITIELECANAWGGLITRTFQLGHGLSAEMQLGNYQHVNCRVVPGGGLGTAAPAIAAQVIPPTMTVYFCWTWDVVNKSTLYTFGTFAAGSNIDLPEGTQGILFDTANVVTWQLAQFGATFVENIAAAGFLQARWASFNANNGGNMIFELKGV